jgi:peptidoglycan/LPS O-acetylase OafA/YrhL
MLQIAPGRRGIQILEDKYRPDIDGLRCLAVLLVVGFHASPKVKAGFVGVDVFFVISGFLITSIILRELESNSFRFTRFYARRIKRIFPALTMVLVASFGIGLFILSPRELTSLGANIVGGAAFSSNFVLLHQTGYFDIAAEYKPLLHLWSLGIEEQFYIFWPLLLLFVAKRGRGLLMLALVIFVVSFAFNVAAIDSYPDLVFFAPLTRGWELALGALLACTAIPGVHVFAQRLDSAVHDALERHFHFRNRSTMLAADVRAAGGMIFMIIALVNFDRNTPFPGWAALLPTFGTLLIISAKDAWINRNILSARPLVFIGLISYPLYLWHWPLLSFLRIALPESATSSMLKGGAVLLSFVLAWLTYCAIERPIRFGKVRLAIPSLCFAISAVGALGFVSIMNNGFKFRLPEPIRYLADTPPGSFTDYDAKCFLGNPDQTYTAFAPECRDTSKHPFVLLWGDSHAASIYPGLKNLSKSIPFGLSQFTASGCHPLLSYVEPLRRYCKTINDFVFKQIKEVHYDIVILAAHWGILAEHGGVDLSKFDYTIAELKGAGISRIIVLGPLPRWSDRGLPNDMIDYYYNSIPHQLIPQRTHFHSYGATLDTQMRQKVLAADVEYISVWDVFCNADGCLTRIGDNKTDITSDDYAHLTVASSVFLVNTIKSRLFPNLLPFDAARQQ